MSLPTVKEVTKYFVALWEAGYGTAFGLTFCIGLLAGLLRLAVKLFQRYPIESDTPQQREAEEIEHCYPSWPKVYRSQNPHKYRSNVRRVR